MTRPDRVGLAPLRQDACDTHCIALENAVSVASLLLLTEATMTQRSLRALPALATDVARESVEIVQVA